MRLLLEDFTLTIPRSALYAVEFQRVTGGWQTTICLGNGQEIAGAVRPSTAAARRAAMDEAMKYVVTTATYIAVDMKRRAEAHVGTL